jgi:RNA polymerase sigma factor (sigma-70 family)
MRKSRPEDGLQRDPPEPRKILTKARDISGRRSSNTWEEYEVKNMPGPDEETKCGDTSEARQAVHAGTIESLRAALQSLPPNEREVFLLRQNGGLAYEEIARQRQCSLETIKQQMRMALKWLRQALND